MKTTKTLSVYLVILSLIFGLTITTDAQEYKLKQSTGMSGMTTESTVYVKKMRKRTESKGYMGIGANIVTIEQCDLRRTITLNTKKKLYFIQPFVQDSSEKTETATNKKPKPEVAAAKNDATAGVITMYYHVLDTGERKKMHGFTARRIWTTTRIIPSAKTCSLKDSMRIETDGWYIDLPEFNCPSDNGGSSAMQNYQKPECQDKYVTKRSGSGKLGFPLSEKRTIIMGGQKSQGDFSMDMQTLELTTGKLDSMLFTIPPDYSQASSYEQLQDKFDMSQYQQEAKNAMNNSQENNNNVATEQKTAGKTRIGVYEPKGEGLPSPSLQQQLVATLNSGEYEAIAVSSEEQARAMNCDMVLSTDFTRVKQAGKLGGIMKAIKNTDPSAASSFNLDATFKLNLLADGSLKTQQKLSGKYEGVIDEAAGKAVKEGGKQVLDAIK
jgi:hypothetical protein